MIAAPASAERKMLPTGGLVTGISFSQIPIEMVVKSEPKKVLIAISLPSTKKAITIRVEFSTTEMLPGVKGSSSARMTAMPLVPPSSSLCGKTNKMVLMPYKILPKRIRE